MKPGTRNKSQGARNRARKMRTSMNVSETVLWKLIRKNQIGFLFRRQVCVGSYILDFYCAEASLAIEVDGPFHALRVEADQARDVWLAERMIAVLRIPSIDLFDEAGILSAQWVDRICTACEERSGRKYWESRPSRNERSFEAPEG